MESSSNHANRRCLGAAIGCLFVAGVIACTAGDAGAIPVGSLKKPDPAPVTESSHVNARLGLGSKPCVSSDRPRPRPGQPIL
jgi:hypothetical protein